MFIGLRSFFAKDFPQAGEFGFNILAGIVVFQDHHRVTGKGRTVCPYSVREDKGGIQAAFSAPHYFFERFSFPARDTPSVKTENASLFHLLIQVLLNRRDFRFPGLHQCYTGAFQLPRRLDEISSVRPQAGFLPPDNQSTRGSRKSAEVLPCMEIVRGIFGIVIISSWDHICVDPFFLHSRAELLYSVFMDCAHLASVIFLIPAVTG